MKKLKFLQMAFKRRLLALCGFTICYLLFAVYRSYAAFEEKIPAARIAALGGASAALSNDANLIFYNPAGLGQIPAAHFSFSQTSLFNISDLPYTTLVGVVPTKNLGSFGFGFTQFGPSIYKETELIFSHSFPLVRKFLFGYNVKNQSLNIKNFGSSGAFGIDIGVYSVILSNLTAGFSIKNINSPTLGTTTEALPQNYRVGLAYYPAVGVIFLLDMSKDLLSDELSYHAGCDINVTKNFAFRSGMRTNPSGFSVGFGFNFGVFRLNYALLNHPVLDAQHFVSLGIKFGPEEVDVAPAERPGRRPRRTTGRVSKIEKLERLKGLKVNINTATVEEFKQIPGIGPLTAQRIVDYREEIGQFSAIEDLLGVPRLTKRVLEKIRPYLTLEEVQTEERGERREERKEKIEAPKTVPKTPRRKFVDDDIPEPETEPEPPRQKIDERKKEKRPVKIEKPVISPVPSKEEKVVEPSEGIDEDLLDINSATAQELEVVGFTSVQAKNIIRYRNKVGGFRSIDELLQVPGVDKKTFESVRDAITVK